MDRRELVQSLAAAAAASLAAGEAVDAAQQPAPSQTKPTVPAAGPQPVNLHEFEALARKRITRMAYDYIAGGGADEVTLRRNRESFDQIRLKPRVLKDVSKLNARAEVLGQAFDYPILLAPTAYHKLAHPEGEIATARGAAAAGATSRSVPSPPSPSKRLPHPPRVGCGSNSIASRTASSPKT